MPGLTRAHSRYQVNRVVRVMKTTSNILRWAAPVTLPLALAAAVGAAVPTDLAFAAWPERSITIIVPFPEGGATDQLGRLLATELAVSLGQNVRVKNIVGEVGIVGVRTASMTAPNGYTLLLTTNAALINTQINKSLLVTSYNTPQDFAPIAYLGSTPTIIVTSASSGIESVGDLIARAKSSPGKLTCASPGIGSSSGIALALLNLRSGVNIAQMQFDGSEPAFMAAASGATDIAAVGIAGLVERIHAENVKVLVQTGKSRWFDLPDVPTMAEAGIPNAVVDTSLMFVAPAGIPASVVDVLTRKTREIIEREEVKAQLRKVGFETVYEGPDALHERVLREISFWEETLDRIGFSKKEAGPFPK